MLRGTNNKTGARSRIIEPWGRVIENRTSLLTAERLTVSSSEWRRITSRLSYVWMMRWVQWWWLTRILPVFGLRLNDMQRIGICQRTYTPVMLLLLIKEPCGSVARRPIGSSLLMLQWAERACGVTFPMLMFQYQVVVRVLAFIHVYGKNLRLPIQAVANRRFRSRQDVHTVSLLGRCV